MMTVQPQTAATPTVCHPDWSRSAAIYQVNTRQFTAEGTLAAAERHLPRLRDLGIGIVWLMPIHPIGEQNRKGTLGSPYAVQDYLAVNPELGTLDDLRSFVATAHALGMHVILDWVANHTAWDNPLVTEHPEWYRRDHDGHLVPTPWWDWADIIDLDYSSEALRAYMIDAMRYWVVEADVDGFRCDTAGFVPTDFWETARAALDAVKPVFLLAEWEARDLHERAFDASYAWSWNESLHHIAIGRADLTALRVYYSWNEKAYPRDAYRMTFVSNHDKNAWEGTEYEQFGDALDAAIVLSVVGEGIPLLYTGQEAGNERRLAFFERDPVEWRDHPMADLYRDLFRLKRETEALWNGAAGGRMVEVVNDHPDAVLSFVRRSAADQVCAVFNLSATARLVRLQGTLHPGEYDDFATGLPTRLTAEPLVLPAWGWKVLVRRFDVPVGRARSTATATAATAQPAPFPVSRS